MREAIEVEALSSQGGQRETFAIEGKRIGQFTV